MSQTQEILAPAAGESVREVQILSWLASTGDTVHPGQAVCEIETEKVALTVHADAGGILTQHAGEGDTIPVGAVIGSIAVDERLKPAPAAQATPGMEPTPAITPAATTRVDPVLYAGPAAQKAMRETGITPASGTGRDGRITRADVMNAPKPSAPAAITPPPQPRRQVADGPGVQRRKMSLIRRRTAEHLLKARQQTAMLTTFQEVDMSRIIQIRKESGESFKERHGIKLGFLSFFNQAITAGLKEFPVIGGRIDGEDIVTFDYLNLGVAVSTPRGLVVPVVRNSNTMTHAAFETELARLAEAARNGKLSLDDLDGGTFTLTNGGVFGSLLSTPLVNIPQSAILGMHTIQDRPVARDGQVVIRPMMYLALSYDHQLIDGRESVGFLIAVKNALENPETPE